MNYGNEANWIHIVIIHHFHELKLAARQVLAQRCFNLVLLISGRIICCLTPAGSFTFTQSAPAG